MINLVPPDARRRIITEYWVRVISAWLFLLAVAATVIGALLLPAFVLVTSQVATHQQAADEARARVEEHKTTAHVLTVASERADRILGLKRTTPLMSVVSVVEAAVPTGGVSISTYALLRVAGEVGLVRVDGEAATRLALAEFRDALLKNDLIAKVDLPISNFAQDRDIKFSLTLTIASSTPAS